MYEAQLFKAAFLAAFFGFMRIGEFAADSKTKIQPSVIKAADIHFDEGFSVTISFPRSKNNQKGLPQVIRLQKAMDSHSPICPVKALTAFAEARPAPQTIAHFSVILVVVPLPVIRSLQF